MRDSKIEWTDHTFNPWIGCQRVSPGCEHCYAEALDKRWGHSRWGPKAERTRTSAPYWKQPLAWNRDAEKAGKRARVFCASLADVFEDRAELAQWREDLFGLIASTPHLDWLLLTKRPENIVRLWPEFVREPGGSGVLPCWPPGRAMVGTPREHEPWPNVWLGTTVEDQARANGRVPLLLSVPAAVRFLSCEPLLEAVDLDRAGAWGIDGDTVERVDWIIVGGESGHGARPFDMRWAHDLRDQAEAHGAAFFMKQVGTLPIEPEDVWRGRPTQRLLNANNAKRAPDGFVPLKFTGKGDDIAEFPEALRVRQVPEVWR